MIGTIKKDLIHIFSSKRERIFYLLYIPFLLLIVDSYEPKWIYFAVIYSYTYLTCISTIAYESNLKFNRVFNSLPITRKEVVIYKYISFFIYLTLVIVYAGVYLWIINTLGIKNVDYFNLEMIIRAIPILMISLSIVFPSYFSLGPRLAQMVHIIVFVSFFIGIISVSGGDLFINKIFQFMASGKFFILASVVYLLSLILSTKLYEGKDL
ncbi:MAG TPA: ABC-2 transporter permease [Tissierellales bacterium]|nr:ABC-2 transporter permease [Tissierellales bacterium]